MVSVKVQNTKGILKAFEKYGDDAVKEFKEITEIRADEIAKEAKNNASIKRVYDNGDLAQNIRSTAIIKYKGLGYTVGAYMPYSAYHEFGTGGLVDIPKGWESMAKQFKGKGIRQVNIAPRPFLYPAFIKGSKLYRKDISEALKYLNKKFNNG